GLAKQLQDITAASSGGGE
ncbi:unnamed protein product, partial [Rotaria magnacalcarata]